MFTAVDLYYQSDFTFTSDFMHLPHTTQNPQSEYKKCVCPLQNN